MHIHHQGNRLSSFCHSFRYILIPKPGIIFQLDCMKDSSVFLRIFKISESLCSITAMSSGSFYKFPYLVEQFFCQISCIAVCNTYLGDFFFIDLAVFAYSRRKIYLIRSPIGKFFFCSLILNLPILAYLFVITCIFCPEHPYWKLCFCSAYGKFYLSHVFTFLHC